MEPIVFTASMPPTQAALKIDGTDGSARVQFDIPAQFRREIQSLLSLAGKTFTISIIEDQSRY